MSFSKTISVFAALCSVFGASIAGFKLAQDSQATPKEDVTQKYEQHITELQEKISGLEKQLTNVNPPPVVSLPPQTQTVVKQVPAPTTPQLPSPPSPPANGNFE